LKLIESQKALLESYEERSKEKKELEKLTRQNNMLTQLCKELEKKSKNTANKAESSTNSNPSDSALPEQFQGLIFKPIDEKNAHLPEQFMRELISSVAGPDYVEKAFNSIPGGFQKMRELYNLAAVHVWEDGKVIGEVDLGVSQLNSSNAHIYFFYLIPEYRQKGRGKILEQWACTAMRNKGYSNASLLCHELNLPAKKFYEKNEWKFTAMHPERPQTLIMEKPLLPAK
jgi:ribosomal protein S18 acetylase RimI-like enzyme